MSVPVLEAIADAIYEYEGNRPPFRAYRNRNPGNLRARPWQKPQDPKGFLVFQSFVAGYTALLAELHAKISGQNVHGIGPNSYLLDLFEVYAPRTDGNDPEEYAGFVAHWIALTYGDGRLMEPLTFREIYAYVGQELPSGVTAA